MTPITLIFLSLFGPLSFIGPLKYLCLLLPIIHFVLKPYHFINVSKPDFIVMLITFYYLIVSLLSSFFFFDTIGLQSVFGFLLKFSGLGLFLYSYRAYHRDSDILYLIIIITLSELLTIAQFLSPNIFSFLQDISYQSRPSGFLGSSNILGLFAVAKLLLIYKTRSHYLFLSMFISFLASICCGSAASLIIVLCFFVFYIFTVICPSLPYSFIFRFILAFLLLFPLLLFTPLLLNLANDSLLLSSISLDAGDSKRVLLLQTFLSLLHSNTFQYFFGFGVGSTFSLASSMTLSRHFESGILELLFSVGLIGYLSIALTILFTHDYNRSFLSFFILIFVLKSYFVPTFLNYSVMFLFGFMYSVFSSPKHVFSST